VFLRHKYGIRKCTTFARRIFCSKHVWLDSLTIFKRIFSHGAFLNKKTFNFWKFPPFGRRKNYLRISSLQFQIPGYSAQNKFLSSRYAQLKNQNTIKAREKWGDASDVHRNTVVCLHVTSSSAPSRGHHVQGASNLDVIHKRPTATGKMKCNRRRVFSARSAKR
jgi:hypothetical protein